MRMPVDRGDSFTSEAVPENLAGLSVQAVDAPLVAGGIGAEVNGAFRLWLEERVLIATDRRADEHAIAPDDGARVSQPWNWRAPGGGPGWWEILAIGYTGRMLATKLRPILSERNA